MKFDELMDRGIRRISKIDEAKSFTVHKMPAGQKPNRSRLQWMREKEHLEDSSMLDYTLGQVQLIEGKLKDAKTKGLSGKEIVKLKEKLIENLVKQIEGKKKSSIEAAFKKIDERRKQHEEKASSFPEVQRRSYDLEKLKLENAHISEDVTMAKLSKMEREKRYNPDEVLVLGAKSERTFKKSKELQEALPSYLADGEDGKDLLEGLERITESREGEISYRVKGSNVYQSVYAGDLLNDQKTVPTAEDIDL